MLSLPSILKIYLHVRPANLHYAFDRLAGIVREEMGCDPHAYRVPDRRSAPPPRHPRLRPSQPSPPIAGRNRPSPLRRPKRIEGQFVNDVRRGLAERLVGEVVRLHVGHSFFFRR